MSEREKQGNAIGINTSGEQCGSQKKSKRGESQQQKNEYMKLDADDAIATTTGTRLAATSSSVPSTSPSQMDSSSGSLDQISSKIPLTDKTVCLILSHKTRFFVDEFEHSRS